MLTSFKWIEWCVHIWSDQTSLMREGNFNDKFKAHGNLYFISELKSSKICSVNSPPSIVLLKCSLWFSLLMFVHSFRVTLCSFIFGVIVWKVNTFHYRMHCIPKYDKSNFSQFFVFFCCCYYFPLSLIDCVHEWKPTVWHFCDVIKKVQLFITWLSQ